MQTLTFLIGILVGLAGCNTDGKQAQATTGPAASPSAAEESAISKVADAGGISLSEPGAAAEHASQVRVAMAMRKTMGITWASQGYWRVNGNTPGSLEKASHYLFSVPPAGYGPYRISFSGQSIQVQNPANPALGLPLDWRTDLTAGNPIKVKNIARVEELLTTKSDLTPRQRYNWQLKLYYNSADPNIVRAWAAAETTSRAISDVAMTSRGLPVTWKQLESLAEVEFVNFQVPADPAHPDFALWFDGNSTYHIAVQLPYGVLESSYTYRNVASGHYECEMKSVLDVPRTNSKLVAAWDFVEPSKAAYPSDRLYLGAVTE